MRLIERRLIGGCLLIALAVASVFALEWSLRPDEAHETGIDTANSLLLPNDGRRVHLVEADVVRIRYPRGGTNYWIVGQLLTGTGFEAFCREHSLNLTSSDADALFVSDFRAFFPNHSLINDDIEQGNNGFNAGFGSIGGDNISAKRVRNSGTVVVKIAGATGY